ncbi:endonuclease domain-containing protein [Mongoliimonas terrestris]|uniref:endonuclease domain-containing protein n=1 Tax=Mongoliimonas terrestris TaxID=1709001 RepID=UPI0009496A7C|nr:endonuclease domain-containing protein [Mongoliimonas terrestris]
MAGSGRMSPEARGNARRLRAGMTEAERRVWYALRAGRFFGLKFRRQVPIGRYIVDFICHERKLVIEIDGGQHGFEEVARRDEIRTAFLHGEGYRVIRFWNHEVLTEWDAVVERIGLETGAWSEVGAAPSPCPSPTRGEGTPTMTVAPLHGTRDDETDD